LKKSERIYKRTVAFAKREFKLSTRYKWPFISNLIITPILHSLPYFILYLGIIPAGATGFDEISSETIIPWIFLGIFAMTVFFSGYSYFRSRFGEEKYWMTINGILIAPVSKYYLLFGVIIQLIINSIVTASVLLTISFIFYPIGIFNFLIIFLTILITLIAGAAAGLINGTFWLVNENIYPLFDYLAYFMGFLSCYSIPYNVFPGFLKVLIEANPLYHFIKIMRTFWIETVTIDILWSFLYVTIFTIVCVIVGVYLFSKVTRRWGVRGY